MADFLQNLTEAQEKKGFIFFSFSLILFLINKFAQLIYFKTEILLVPVWFNPTALFHVKEHRRGQRVCPKFLCGGRTRRRIHHPVSKEPVSWTESNFLLFYECFIIYMNE